MKEYLGLLEDVLTNGVVKQDRTGTGTKSVFGRQLRFDLSKGFPAVTTKKLFWKGVVAELLWFLKGSTDNTWLKKQGVTIWDEWADKEGYLGPIYGYQWRSWPDHNSAELKSIDQIANVIDTIKKNPNSRRMLVSAWNVADLSGMALEPCHVFFQFYVTPAQLCTNCEGKREVPYQCLQTRTGEVTYYKKCEECNATGFGKAKLSCQMYQRSADMFLGVPFNIASYALLTHMIAQVCDLEVGEYVHTFGDTHIYLNHLSQVNIQMQREPHSLPKLWLNPSVKDIDSFQIDDCKLVDYNPHPAISAPVAV